MAKNFKQPGKTLDVPAPADVKSGDGVLIGKLFGVAQTDAKQGEMFALDREGVWDLPKTEAQAWAVGDVVYWSGTEVTTTANGNTKIGFAVAVAGNPSKRGDVVLSQ
ncbi:MAG: capsid cement protein [Agrobacterium vaccinii]